MTVVEFYDNIVKIKFIIINEKYRGDALRTFVAGLRKPLCDIIFASRPASLPNTLALAQEVENNQEIYALATIFANRNEEKKQNMLNKNKSFKQQKNGSTNKNTFFSNVEKKQSPKRGPEPMDVDPS